MGGEGAESCSAWSPTRVSASAPGNEVRSRVQFFPNGYAAMAWLASTRGTGDLGITQITEILPNAGVAYAGPLPDEFQMKAICTSALATRAPEPPFAEHFIARLRAPGARALLAQAGFEVQGRAV